MKYISLSEINSAAKTKAPGFLSEAFKRGVKQSNCLGFNDQDYQFLKNYSNLSKLEPSVSKVEDESPVSDEVLLKSGDVEKEVTDKNLFINSSNEKQSRVGRARIS